MTECPLCHEDAGFRVKLVDGQAMHTCNACKGVIPSLPTPAPVQMQLPVAPVARPQLARNLLQPLTPGSLLKQAKARVKEIDRVLRDMKRLENERAELQRLIEAATEGQGAGRAARRFVRATEDACTTVSAGGATARIQAAPRVVGGN